MKAPTLSASAAILLRIDMDADAFGTDWKHCDQIANYLARLVSFARADTFLYSNLYSTVLNELLEIVFCRHCPQGSIECVITRDGSVDRVELEIPVSPEHSGFYREGVLRSQALDARDAYTRSLLGEVPVDLSVGLLELATDYGARIWLDPTADAQRIRLTVDVCLEEVAAATP